MKRFSKYESDSTKGAIINAVLSVVLSAVVALITMWVVGAIQ